MGLVPFFFELRLFEGRLALFYCPFFVIETPNTFTKSFLFPSFEFERPCKQQIAKHS